VVTTRLMVDTWLAVEDGLMINLADGLYLADSENLDDAYDLPNV
jgi:hypothetical protein